MPEAFSPPPPEESTQRIISRMRMRGIHLVDWHLVPGLPVLGHTVAELQLPKGCVLVAILREDTALLPRGDACLQSGDHLIAAVDLPGLSALGALLGPQAGVHPSHGPRVPGGM